MDTERKVVGIFIPCRRKQRFHGPVPEGGGDVIDWETAQLPFLRRNRLAEYAYCFLQMEADCVTFMNEHQATGELLLKPIQKSFKDFQEDTFGVGQFLKHLGNERSALIYLGMMEYDIEELGRYLEILARASTQPSRRGRDMGYTFRKIEEKLLDLRQTVAELSPLQGVSVPALTPAYRL